MAKEITLANGQKMPAFGLGTWLSSKDEVKIAVRAALDAGYRMIDTAYNYLNEDAIGEVLQEYFKAGKLKREDIFITTKSSKDEVKIAVRAALDAGYRMIDTAYNYLNEDAIGEVLQEYFKAGKLKREDIFITTKLGSIYTRPCHVKTSMESSLSKLGVDYVDLYLYHLPLSFKFTGDPNNVIPLEDGKLQIDEDVDFCDVWKVMEELVEEGKTKSLGISNFNSEQTTAICNAAKIKPVVNQVECHAHFPQFELEKFSRDSEIYIMAYAPIGSPGRGKSGMIPMDKNEVSLLQDETVLSIAKTPAQVLLRNLLQRDIIVIPKSVTPSRIVENIQVYDFDLAKEDMDALNRLKKGRLFRSEGLQESKNYPFNIPY